MSYSHGELTNYSAIARDCAVDAKTVKEYYQILVDTLVGNFVQPFSKPTGRQSITSTPKFYLFDVGVAGFVCHRTVKSASGAEFGRALEHFILMELLAYKGYREKDFSVEFWRTKQGLEVDFVLNRGEIAIEVKGKVRSGDLTPMRAFISEFNPRHAIIVSNDEVARMVDGIQILPWKEFLSALWSGEYI